ncbi:MAG: hypothetical protein O2877_02655 [bacterium]|nr:hypothetical protein [bacterium]
MPIKITLPLRTLELLGLKEKDMDVYTTLLRLGSAPLRRIADETRLNRGTTYDALKRLLDMGLVSYVDAKSHRYFTSEDPQKLRGLATRREVAVQEARDLVIKILPDLESLSRESKNRPTVRYYGGPSGVTDILNDVLATTQHTESKQYLVYSSAGIRDLIANAWPTFNATRVKKEIHVRAIAIGEGGKTIGLDERKWLAKETNASTYIFIYGSKTAYVSVDDNNKLFGVIIEDEAITSTQKLIFQMLWDTLPS